MPAPPPAASLPLVHWRSAFDGVHQALREELFHTKSALDSIPEAVYFTLRDTVFPLEAVGPGRPKRDALKLDETMEAAGLWLQVAGGTRTATTARQRRAKRQVCFVDLCGGPGSFAQVLFQKCPKHKAVMTGVGMTLTEQLPSGSGGKPSRSEWFSDLAQNPSFMAVVGTDGTGNVMQTENLLALASVVARMPVKIVVSDGNVDLPFEIANYQEPLHARLIFSQWLGALLVLKPGGCVALKFVDTFAPFTRSLVYLTTFFFGRVQIVKPKHSRAVNSARFLVGVNFQGLPADWRALLLHAHQHCFTDEMLVISFVAPDIMANDPSFATSFGNATQSIAANQMACIKRILTADGDRKLRLKFDAEAAAVAAPLPPPPPPAPEPFSGGPEEFC